MHHPVIVLKFGGSVLRGEQDLARCVREAYRWVREGRRVVAVVSAFEGQTDALLARANAVTPTGAADARALLLSTGEFTSAALLALSAHKAGVAVRVCGPHEVDLRTSCAGQDADPASVDAAHLRAVLAAVPLVVVPGFVGVGPDRQVTLLGRGGSDLTAILLANQLGARCRLIKDVDGLYERDPAQVVPGPPPRRFRQTSWDCALSLDGGIVQHKAVRFAKERGLAFEVGTFQGDEASVIGPHQTRWFPARAQRRPLRVSVLGCGVVGGGVARALMDGRDGCVLSRVLTRRAGSLPPDLPPDSATTRVEDAIQESDVVVELLGGVQPAAEWVHRALCSGKHVVTANKSLIVTHGTALEQTARAHGVSLRFSAAVGGAVPMLETIGRAAREEGVASLECVVNGTCNFILNTLQDGRPLQTAIGEAQRLGFAEADPTRDVDGTDSHEKLRLLARAAWGMDARTADFARLGIVGDGSAVLHAPRPPGSCVRLVARARRVGCVVDGGVAPAVIAPGHPLHDLPGAGNRLCLRTTTGRCITVDGTGAGRWPTTESVLGDLLELARGDRAAHDAEEPREGAHHAA